MSDQNPPDAIPLQGYACGHTDIPLRRVGHSPYSIQIPSNGGRLCPVCFLADCHEPSFLEHEQRLNLGPLEADTPYNSWFSLLLRQREVLRFEHDLQFRIDLSEAGKHRVWEGFLASVRSISAQYDPHCWQAFLPSCEPVYRETERTFTDALLAELLSGWPVPACDGVVTSKVVDVAQVESHQEKRVSLKTLDEWRMASAQGPLVLVCHKTTLRRYGSAFCREQLPEQVAYLVEDPVTLHLFWQATYYEFRQDAIVDGKRSWVHTERPFYRIEQPRLLTEQSFPVKPGTNRFGLSWCYHFARMPIMEPLRWIDDLWETGGVARWLQCAAEIRIDRTGDSSVRRISGEDQRLPCLYCTQPIDPANVRSEGDPEYCSSGCFAASRRIPFTEVYAQQVRRRQKQPLACLGSTPALCTCQHHDPTACTMQRYHLSQAEMRKQFLPCRCACHFTEKHKSIGEKGWKDVREVWEKRWREWRLQHRERDAPE